MHAKMPIKQSCRYCGSSHPPRQFTTYEKMYAECGKVNHFKEVCRHRKNRTVHDLEKKQDQQHEIEDHIDIVNIHSIIFNRKWVVITAIQKTSSNQVSIIEPYKVDTCSGGNIMPLHLYKILFPRTTKEKLAAPRNKSIQ